jgi:hypothetical protein
MTAWAFSATDKICVYRYFLLFTHYDPHRAISFSVSMLTDTPNSIAKSASTFFNDLGDFSTFLMTSIITATGLHYYLLIFANCDIKKN